MLPPAPVTTMTFPRHKPLKFGCVEIHRSPAEQVDRFDRLSGRFSHDLSRGTRGLRSFERHYRSTPISTAHTGNFGDFYQWEFSDRFNQVLNPAAGEAASVAAGHEKQPNDRTFPPH